MNRRQLLSAGAAGVFAQALAGSANAALTGPDFEAIGKITTEGLGSATSKVMDTASWMTDMHGPRLTGSPNVQKAARWVVDKMTAWGFTGCQMEPWPADPAGLNNGFPLGWSNDKFYLQATAPYPFPIPGTPTAWTPGTNGLVSGEAVLVTETTEAALTEKWAGKLAGKWILPTAEQPIQAQWTPPASRYSRDQLDNMETPARTNENGAPAPARAAPPPTIPAPPTPGTPPFVRNAWFKAQGALGVISTSRNAHGVYTVNGATPRDNGPNAITIISIAAEQYGRLARLSKAGTPALIEADIRNSWPVKPPMFNIVGEVRGTDKADEVVILGGHFDSWHAATGATDNAAGCAVMLEALRILKATKVPLRRTVRVVLWTGEEEGLLGSRAYVRAHFGNVRDLPATATTPGTPPPPLGPMLPIKPEHGKFQAYFNLDNGTGAIRGVYAQGNLAAVPIFREWMEGFRNIGATHVNVGNTGSTDHVSFDTAGLPGFQFIQDGVDYNANTHHTNLDFYDALQPEDMRRNATIVAGFAYMAANMAGKFPRKAPAPSAPATPPAAPPRR